MVQSAQPTTAFFSFRSVDATLLPTVTITVEITVRALTGLRDYRACEALQRVTWGHDFAEVVPAAILKISQKVGGIATGAFTSDGAMAGFVFGITGWKDGAPCHWSHMLAVDPAFRDHGIGRQLKEHQRAELLAHGVEVMYWTFDPLVARNAYLNICRLGVQVAEYVPDMYGADDENALDQIIGTDRFIARWDLVSPMSWARDVPGNVPAINCTVDDRGTVIPVDGALPDAPTIRIGIPEDIHALKGESPERAAAWRANTRRAFMHYLGAEYQVCGFSTNPAEHASYYLLRRGE